MMQLEAVHLNLCMGNYQIKSSFGVWGAAHFQNSFFVVDISISRTLKAASLLLCTKEKNRQP